MTNYIMNITMVAFSSLAVIHSSDLTSENCCFRIVAQNTIYTLPSGLFLLVTNKWIYKIFYILYFWRHI